jgi:hypothetical protein
VASSKEVDPANLARPLFENLGRLILPGFGSTRFSTETWWANFTFQQISRLLPTAHASVKNLDVVISHVDVFFCLTGRSRFPSSIAVENDFLLFGNRGESGIELMEGDGTF